MFDRAAEGGTRSGEAATTSRGGSKSGLWSRFRPTAQRPAPQAAGRTQSFVVFVAFVV